MWLVNGDIRTDDYMMIYWGGQESQRGVAIILDRKTAQCIKQVECVNDQLMMVKLSAEPVDLMLVCVYMLTSDYDVDDVEAIYEQMEQLMTL